MRKSQSFFIPWAFWAIMLFGLHFSLAATAAEAGAPLAVVPFTSHSGLIFVDGLVNGKPVEFVLDSAASRAALDLEKANELGLDISREALNSGVNTARPQTVRIAMDVTYQIGGADVTEPVTVVYSQEFLSKRIQHPVKVIIGGSFLRKYVVEVNYPKSELRIHQAESFSYSGTGRVVSLEVTPSDLLVRGRILPAIGRKTVEGNFSLDTAATGGDLVLWNKGLELQKEATNLNPNVQTSFGGTKPTMEGTLEEFRTGDVSIPNPKVRFIEIKDNPGAYALGNIGSGFFERFKVIFDAPHGKLILE